jgi:hypothetical protein
VAAVVVMPPIELEEGMGRKVFGVEFLFTVILTGSNNNLCLFFLPKKK